MLDEIATITATYDGYARYINYSQDVTLNAAEIAGLCFWQSGDSISCATYTSDGSAVSSSA